MTGELRRVIDGGYCIGCGACAAMEHEKIELPRSSSGMFTPLLHASDRELDDAERVCPFASSGKDEDVLGQELFANAPHWSPYLGHYREILAGYVAEGDYRNAGSSGGMGTWLLTEALREGFVDHVICVRSLEGEGDSSLFGYVISEDVEDTKAGSKSRYYPIEMSQIIAKVRDTPGRYAFVGIPCFLKALRNICAIDPVVRERVIFFVGLFCGHLKTGDFAASLAWQLGIPPKELAGVDFRQKLSDRSADSYGFSAIDTSGREVAAPMAQLFGREWGLGLFKPHACEFCDDVVGEVADVSVGDAWLPRFVGDPKGTNILIVRSEIAARLIANARNRGRLDMHPLSAEDAYRSQEGGFNHRRGGLSFRMWLKDTEGKWRPKKRVKPGKRHLTAVRRKIYQLRSHLSSLSHLAFSEAERKNDFGVFRQRMRGPITAYHRLLRIEYYQNRVKYMIEVRLLKLKQIFSR
ncbi:MAG TPA: Coenzyme F420 hydrogenase/dehydrogenase, beta subunit C-terminal domain [Rhizomicrobium sp.]|nr:Coenzyme F420 hydrogenase/dehydrogenase, beta subunit C-terminal domain [Rhizomicrobium sp.]